VDRETVNRIERHESCGTSEIAVQQGREVVRVQWNRLAVIQWNRTEQHLDSGREARGEG
jgi:hypothetical protein